MANKLNYLLSLIVVSYNKVITVYGLKMDIKYHIKYGEFFINKNIVKAMVIFLIRLYH